MNEENNSRCTVCTSPSARPMIAALLECGSSLEEMCAHTGLMASEIEMHLTHLATAIAAPVEEDTADDPLSVSDARLKVLLRRAHETYIAAGLQADTKTQVSALGAQLRLELEIARRAELKRARTQSQPLPHDPSTWPDEDRQRVRDYLDWIVRDHNSSEEKAGIQ
jgi:hypothetical protein